MTSICTDVRINAREKALADGIKEVAAELRLIDIVNLVVFIHIEKHGNIDDLINSSVELYFKPDTLRYGWASSADLTWGGPARIYLDMEFRHLGVTVFFSLILGALSAGVDIHNISFEHSSGDPEENTARLIDAIAAARL
jgi:hypothetical protein